MPTTIQITTNNYDGQTAIITYYPDTGGTINLGTQVLPYDYTSEYYYGSYSLYFPYFDTTCTLVILSQTPTPTPTHTITPTPTPTMTPTPSPTQPQKSYIYQLCNLKIITYVVQTEQIGLPILPDEVIKNGDGNCYRFSGMTTSSLSVIPIGSAIINATGNYFTSMFNTIYTTCEDCEAPIFPVNCLIVTGTLIPPDNQHPNGGVINYYDEFGILHTIDQIWFNNNTILNASSVESSSFVDIYECTDCLSYELIGPKNRTYTSCEGTSQIVVVPAGDSVIICAKGILVGGVNLGFCV